ncbi:MAG: hypothetical protein RLP09_17390 [Sandaracinaceae bacterium]
MTEPSRHLLPVLLAVLGMACEPAESSCLSGESTACDCPSGARGAQSCEDGRFGACRCDSDAGQPMDGGRPSAGDAAAPNDASALVDARVASDAGPPVEGVLFEEDFDDLPDWTSGDEGAPLPGDFYSMRADSAFAMSDGFPGGREAIEILEGNVEMARGGAGKSLVMWRDSNGPDWYWGSDSMLTVYFPEGHDELYLRFWIRFDPDWTPDGESGMTKLFRFSSWDPDDGPLYQAFPHGANGPILIWDYQHNDYGTRNLLAFRGHPQETNYRMTDPPMINLPRRGNTSMNFDDDIRDLDGDGVDDNVVDQLRNLITGEPVSGTVSHEELYGDVWHEVEFHIRMNSGPGVYDGVLQQWLDGQLIFRNVTLPWRGTESTGDPLWNVVSFGGNSHFHAYPESERRQEWRAIDDILIRDSLPPERR